MDDRERTIIEILHEYRVAHTRKAFDSGQREKKLARRFSLDFAMFIPDQIAFAVHSGNSRSAAVGHVEFFPLPLKPAIESYVG